MVLILSNGTTRNEAWNYCPKPILEVSNLQIKTPTIKPNEDGSVIVTIKNNNQSLVGDSMRFMFRGSNDGHYVYSDIQTIQPIKNYLTFETDYTFTISKNSDPDNANDWFGARNYEFVGVNVFKVIKTFNEQRYEAKLQKTLQQASQTQQDSNNDVQTTSEQGYSINKWNW